MKIIFFLIALPLIVISSSICQAQTSSKCEQLIELFRIEKIVKDLQLRDKEIKIIRLIDRDGYFKKCQCESQLLYVRAIREIPLDINTGHHTDFVILDVKNKKNNTAIKFFYAIGQTLWSGKVIFNKNGKKLIIEEFTYYIVN